jgi:hypothetical protein
MVVVVVSNKIRIPLGLRARPLDFYVAFLVFFIGFSGIIDPTWPERFDHTPAYWLVWAEGIYLMAASIIIMISLLIREKKKCRVKLLVTSIIGEMFGWLFVSSASWVIVLTSWYVPPSLMVEANNPISFWAWVLVWIGLGVASFMRYMDLKHYYRSGNGE